MEHSVFLNATPIFYFNLMLKMWSHFFSNKKRNILLLFLRIALRVYYFGTSCKRGVDVLFFK